MSESTKEAESKMVSPIYLCINQSSCLYINLDVKRYIHRCIPRACKETEWESEGSWEDCRRKHRLQVLSKGRTLTSRAFNSLASILFHNTWNCIGPFWKIWQFFSFSLFLISLVKLLFLNKEINPGSGYWCTYFEMRLFHQRI